MCRFSRWAARRSGRRRFEVGRIVGFPSPPGTIYLAKGMPHRIMISTADFQKRYEFPYICSYDDKELSRQPPRHHAPAYHGAYRSDPFFKTRKEETKKFIAKYARQNNPQYLRSRPTPPM